ncbi:hypothetical protein [Thermoactinomyces sp. CICC 10521]|nr:hypothetical protein [Thermoactinomyces sp. CICC 10521]
MKEWDPIELNIEPQDGELECEIGGLKWELPDDGVKIDIDF